MLKKIYRYFYNFIYALPFGLKGADNEILGHKTSTNNTQISIQQKVTDEKLSDALLNGEVTQEVEELRYRTYKVAQESQNYNYIGEGIAVKNKERKLPNIFYIKNHIICESVGHELKRINDYSIDRYVLKVDYSDIPRFKVEKFCNYVKVNLKKNELSLFFEKNTDNPERRMFYNELEKNGESLKSDLFEYPINIKFISEDTFYEFTFKNKFECEFRNEEMQYVIVYRFKESTIKDIVKENFSETMDKKYKNKEKKENVLNIVNTERKCYCSSCGKEMNTYDGDITKKSFGYYLCNDCLKQINELKYLEK